MAIRYGDRSRVSTPVSGWLNNDPLTLTPRDIQRSASVTVTADSTKDVKGAFTEVIASTTADTNFIYLSLAGTSISGSNTGMLLDVAIGGAGSESVVIADVPCGWQSNIQQMLLNFPLAIPAGSRVSARCAAFIASDTVQAQFTTAIVTGFVGSNLIETFGAVSTDSRGTNIPGDNAYVQLVASTSKQYRAIVMTPCLGANANVAVASENSTYTLGIGASGSEVDVMTVPIRTEATEQMNWAVGTRTSIYAPASPIAVGNRLAVKQTQGRTYRDVIIFGVV